MKHKKKMEEENVKCKGNLYFLHITKSLIINNKIILKTQKFY